MSKITLTENQRVVLNAAAHRANLVAWPLPRRLKLSPGSATIVVRGLLAKRLIEKRPAMGADPVWKEDSGKPLTLVISKSGLAACEIIAADEPAQKGSVAANKAVVTTVSQGEPRMPRVGSKLATLVELLGRRDGATVAELAKATGWQSHSVRGVMSGMLTKFGFQLGSDKVEGRGRVYRLRL